ncbi:hypothetical protein OGATHE_003865 [Ogataea polymorpha]|uniref:Uncharacterized protein n=1 Tax=Ogataea polymorpha TaxID=460523 RepID=A0A9P8P4U3_9ASCO|nr:hypothetical protein OGATHE_003865 [Ogataea polymorpha]
MEGPCKDLELVDRAMAVMDSKTSWREACHRSSEKRWKPDIVSAHVELGQVKAVKRHFGGGGNDVSGVDSSQRNTVDLEWAGNKKGVVLKVLQVDNPLASESSSKKNQNGARNK